MSFEDSLLLGFAHVAVNNPNAEIALWAELDLDGNPVPGPQPAGSVGIYLNVAPEGVDSVTLTDYPVADDPAPADPVIGVQARIACKDPDAVAGIVTDLYALFQDRWTSMLGRVKLVKASRASGTRMGQDVSERLVRVENYYLTVHRPSPNRNT